MLKPLGSAVVSAAMAAVFFLAAGPAEGQQPSYTCSGKYSNSPINCVLGDPLRYFPGANAADNFTPQVGALFPENRSLNNIVTFSGGIIYAANPGSGRTGPAGDVYGGIGDKAPASGNQATISGGQIYNVFGGLGAGFGATLNTVTIGNAAVRGAVYGGRIISGSSLNAQQNTVYINPGAIIYGNVYGAYTVASGSYLTMNRVIISGGEIRGDIISGAYDFLSGFTVQGNSVNISGGTVNNANIYGGRGQSSAANPSTISNNTVTITGGIINNAYTGKGIYGGQDITGNSAVVQGNIVTISGGTVNADIYGGYNYGNGLTSGNEVTLSGGAITGKYIFGCYGGGKGAVSGNSVTIGNVDRLTGDIYGGYSAGGGAVTNNTVTFNNSILVTVTYGGAILGASLLTKSGEGTLILTRDNAYSGPTTISAGTLQIGGGGATGSITGNIINNAALAFSRSNAYTFSDNITGSGKVIQRGAGTLTLMGDNAFTGGTEIESGTLVIANEGALGRAINPSSNAGQVTFRGKGNKTVRLDPDIPTSVCPGNPPYDCIQLKNSFRTEATGTNLVDLRASAPVEVYGINTSGLSGPGGAFNVAANTTLDVYLTSSAFTENKAGGRPNDINVEAGGKLNLTVHSVGDEPSLAFFASGLSGAGNLNISTKGPGAAVFVNGFNGASNLFKMGSTTVQGSEGNLAILLLERYPGGDRLNFENEEIFEIKGGGGNASVSAILMGDGIVDAETINVTKGAALAPTNLGGPGTLTLRGDTINITDFALLYMAYRPQSYAGFLSQDDEDNDIPTTNNDLLNLDSDNVVTLKNGTVYFRTFTNDPIFKEDGDYLIIRSKEGFNDGNTDITSNTLLNAQLSVNVDGFDLIRDSGTVRGSYKFKLGDDPVVYPDTGGYKDDDGSNKNIWFVLGEGESQLNSLSMAWKGKEKGLADPPVGGIWESGPFFHSLQAESPSKEDHEHRFMTGDKVYIYGGVSLGITLPSRDVTVNNRSAGYDIIVSGLVVGQDMTNEEKTYDGNYTITGEGGITAKGSTAFGKYVADDYHEHDKLVPTGKLEKFGQSTLVFKNTGGNMFMGGIDLHGGTVEFTLAEQLGVSVGSGIAFKGGEPTLFALNHAHNSGAITLASDLIIEDGVIGRLAAGCGLVLTYTGLLKGSGNFDLSGPGTVEFNSNSGSYQEAATVSGGAFSGKGTLGGSLTIKDGAAFKPGTVEEPFETFTVRGELAFNAGSGFNIEVEYGPGGVKNNMVTAGGLVTIDKAAGLSVWADYMKIPPSNFEGPITIIDASGSGSAESSEARFVLNSRLPRGFEWKQGWDEDTAKLFQLWLDYDPNKGYAFIPGGSHNQSEIGKNIDWFVVNRDPGLSEIINRLSDGWDDGQVLKMMDQLTGDLAANALFMALKEPWRHPFNRLDSGDDREGPRFWVELTGRHERFENDGNAHGFTINRPGFAFGLDYAPDPKTILGANFQYTKPRLGQDTGSIRADDYEFGLYGLASFEPGFDLKAYFGYSRQEYDFRRIVRLPASPHFKEPFYEQLGGNTRGEALSASLELTWNIPWRDDIRLTPLAALDYEKATMRGFTEAGGQAALVYGDASLERLMFRAGLGSGFAFQNGLYLKPKAQFGVRLNDQKQPAVGAKFARAALPGQPTADIWGAQTGGGYLGLGLGGGLNLGGDKSLYTNYEAKIYNRASIHSGEAGFMIRW